MSRWINIDMYVATDSPEIILNQQNCKSYNLTDYELKYYKSKWFHGSEGNAKIEIFDGDLYISDRGIRDRSIEEDGDDILNDFRDIIKQCNGNGYLKARDGVDIVQIEIYDGVETITRFSDAYCRFYEYKKSHLHSSD